MVVLLYSLSMLMIWWSWGENSVPQGWLAQEFDIKDLYLLRCFLGLEVAYSGRCLSVNANMLLICLLLLASQVASLQSHLLKQIINLLAEMASYCLMLQGSLLANCGKALVLDSYACWHHLLVISSCMHLPLRTCVLWIVFSGISRLLWAKGCYFLDPTLSTLQDMLMLIGLALRRTDSLL